MYVCTYCFHSQTPNPKIPTQPQPNPKILIPNSNLIIIINTESAFYRVSSSLEPIFTVCNAGWLCLPPVRFHNHLCRVLCVVSCLVLLLALTFSFLHLTFAKTADSKF